MQVNEESNGKIPKKTCSLGEGKKEVEEEYYWNIMEVKKLKWNDHNNQI